MANFSGQFDREGYTEQLENIYDPPGSNSEKSRFKLRKSPLIKGIAWGFSLGLVALVSACLGAGYALLSPYSSLKSTAVWQKSDFYTTKPFLQSSNSPLLYELSRPVNILVMGIDRVLDTKDDTKKIFNGRSDTMLLVRFDPTDHSIRVLSIPRDSRVRIPGRGFTKINDANVLGGPMLASDVVRETLNGVTIDRYVRVTTDAFKELIDLAGGVEINVPERMYHRDVTQKLFIDLQPGLQTLNGEQAEQFARYRNKMTGDIGRVQRQQVLMKALQKQLLDPTLLPRLPQGMEIMQKYTDTNLTVEEMFALATFGLSTKSEDVRMVLLPGHFNALREYDGRSYWVLDVEEINKVVNNLFNENTATNRENNHLLLRIAVQNGTNHRGLANNFVRYLKRQGYENAYVQGDAEEKLIGTEIIVQKGDIEGANSLKNRIGIGKVESSSIGSLNSDITIRLGEDAQQFQTK